MNQHPPQKARGVNNMEELALVQFLKNKSGSMQGATHAETTKYVQDILHV